MKLWGLPSNLQSGGAPQSWLKLYFWLGCGSWGQRLDNCFALAAER
jgi:hypothetical protein